MDGQQNNESNIPKKKKKRDTGGAVLRTGGPSKGSCDHRCLLQPALVKTHLTSLLLSRKGWSEQRTGGRIERGREGGRGGGGKDDGANRYLWHSN